MALKVNNIIVGLKVEPEKALPNHELVGSFNSIRNNLKMQEPTAKYEPVKNDKYVIRTEGELIVNVNRKSDYLKDALDLD